jgi:hypothetical protein
MTSHEGLTFFRFFWISYARFETHMKWQRPKTPARAQAVRIPLFSHLFSEEMTCCRSKMIFAKNQEVYFLALKCKTTPVPAKSVGTCTKFKKYLWRLPQQNESWYAYPRWSTIYVGCFLELSISRFGSCFIKKPDFGTPKMESDSFGGFQLLLGSRYIETLVRWVRVV